MSGGVSTLNVIEKLNVANVTVVRVGESAHRKEMRLIDGDALREVVLNAIIYNDYINGYYPAFEIYDDRIEIISSGGLPVGLSEEEFFEGRSMPRNKELMRIFSDLGLCEQLGSGMKKILKVYPKEIFSISEHFITAKLGYDKEAMQILGNYSEQEKKRYDSNGGVNSLDLSVTAQKVFVYVEKNNNVSTSKIVEDLGLAKRSVERAIKELRDKHYIRRIGSDKTGYYEIIK